MSELTHAGAATQAASESSSEPHRALRLRSAAALLACGAGVAHLAYHYSYTLDDAFISFRYSRNLARGMGLVYNPGEYVKGYSNTLYTLLMAVPEWVGLGSLHVAKGIGLASFLALCWLGYCLYEKDPTPDARDRGAWLVALFALSTSLAVHYIGGLETGLHTTLIFAAVLTRLNEQRSRKPPWSALVFTAVVLSRPEGILIFGAMAAHDIGVRIRARSFSWRELTFYLLPLLAYAGELTLSAAYYGDPLPQTYYVKARAAHGLRQSLRVLWDGLHAQARSDSTLSSGLHILGLGPFVFGLALVALLARERRRENAAFLMIVAAQLVFVLQAEDDWAPAWRFGTPMFPALFVLLLEALGALAALGARVRGKRRALATVLCAGTSALMAGPNLEASSAIQARRYVDGGILSLEGEKLRPLADSGALLASYDIGGQGYTAGGFDIFDGAGLTLREMVGCRNKLLLHCIRYAELALPEIVRRHFGKKKDQFVVIGVTRAEPYVALDDERHMLQRKLALVPQAPAWALAVAGTQSDEATVVAADAAPAVRAGQETDLTLYWRRGTADPSQAAARTLSWSGPRGTVSARATETLLQRGLPAAEWHADELFADRALIHAPATPGKYELRANAAGSAALALASVEVVAPSDAPARAAELIATGQRQLRAGDELGAIRVLRRAVQLASTDRTRSEYQRMVIGRTLRMRRDAERLGEQDRVAALRELEQARILLHGAYWESGRASRPLRAEIDANAALYSRLITAEMKLAPAGKLRFPGPKRKKR